MSGEPWSEIDEEGQDKLAAKENERFNNRSKYGFSKFDIPLLFKRGSKQIYASLCCNVYTTS